MSQPTLGRIVHYKLAAHDAVQINRRRLDAQREKTALEQKGYQVHVGNETAPGDVFPAIIVRVWPTSVQLQVFLDGNDTFWATSVSEGDGERQWSWPPRV